MDESAQGPALQETGVAGFDEVLRGGLTARRMYLLEGPPGSGKTTLAMQFLRAGAARGERCLFVSLSESEEELRLSARSHGWDLTGIGLFESIATEQGTHADGRYTMFHASEVELAQTTKAILAEVTRLKPARLVLDSLSEVRLLADNELRYRRQVLALKQHFSTHGATVLFLDDRVGRDRDMHLHSLAHGVIVLERQIPDYGPMWRRLHVPKLRGRPFAEGYHDFAIRRGGVVVFPRLVANEHRTAYAREAVPSGVPALDALLGGGLSRGTSSLFMGPAGCGKSVLATQYLVSAAARGERGTAFLFDESVATYLERSAGLGQDVARWVDAGRIALRQIDPAELSPGEFAAAVRHAVEVEDHSIIVIDSLNGYLNAMPNERFVVLNLHEMLTFLGQQGVTTLLLMAQHGLLDSIATSPIDASYLADTVVLLRYFEALGEVRKAISVVKKRTGRHEATIRELRMDRGIHIGEPIREFHGVLSGTPRVVVSAPAPTPSHRDADAS